MLLHRQQGVNRYDICQLLAPKLKHLTPSPSTGLSDYPAGRAESLDAAAETGETALLNAKPALGAPSLSKDLWRLLSGVGLAPLAWAEVVRSEEPDGDV